MSPEVYKQMGQPHIGNDKVISVQDAMEIQKVVSAHTSTWVKILNMGGTWGQTDRFRKTTVNETANVPPLYLFLKDHKVMKEGKLPKTRPVCSS